MACVFWQDECETRAKEFMKKSTLKDVIKVTINKFEDKDGCEGRGSICVISIPMNKFKDQ